MAKETPFSITTATMTIDDVAYCASDVNFSHSTEALTFQCMASVNPVTFPGLETWGGSCTLAYDVLGMDELWGLNGTISFVLTKSTGGTITLSGTIQITDVSATFSNSELPSVSVTFVGSGELQEAV